jgi:exonuclease SbcD
MRLAAPREFLRMGRIHVVGLASEAAACVVNLPSENPSVSIAAVPYLSENELSHISFETEPERAERYRERSKAFYRQCVECMPPGLPKILMGHLFVHGGEESGSERNIQIGGATAMRISDFPNDVTYVALGHLHRPHALSGTSYPVQYAGSPLPLRFNEANYSKKVYLLDVPASGDVRVEDIEIPVFKELRTVPGNLDEVRSAAMSSEWDGTYIQVQLQDYQPAVGISDEIREIFNQRGGDVLSVEVEPPTQTDRQEISIEEMQQPTEIFERFYQERFDAPPDELMMETFNELLQLVEE